VIDVDDVDSVDDAIEPVSDVEQHEDSNADVLVVDSKDHHKLCFCVSKTTGRVHVLDADKRPVGCNFKIADWQAVENSSQVFGEALDNEPFAIRLTEAFLRQWKALKIGEQRKRVDQILFLPLSGSVQKKSRCSKQVAAKTSFL